MFADKATLSVVSQVLGWLSTLAWSISFYPQAILNYRRKSTRGLSLDFVYLNVQGFLSYSVYNSALFFSASVRKEYQRRNGGHDPSVRGNDVAFAVHAFVISVFTLWQTLHYKRAREQVVSPFTAFFLATARLLIFTGALAALLNFIEWLDVLYFLSYLKLVISFYKYIPQAWINFKRKSTIGWSIHNILLDFTGGIGSLTQMLIDAERNSDWGSLRGNPAKLILSVLAMLFDTIFMFQHYVLYRHSDADAKDVEANRADVSAEGSVPTERSPLLL